MAAQLNEWDAGLAHRSRQNGKPAAAQPLPVSGSAVLDGDSDSEPEDLVRNDGTLLASEPPKPL